MCSPVKVVGQGTVLILLGCVQHRYIGIFQSLQIPVCPAQLNPSLRGIQNYFKMLSEGLRRF